MNNLSALTYNIQTLFSSMSSVQNKLQEFDNQILNLKSAIKQVPSSTPEVNTDDIVNNIMARINVRLDSLEKQIQDCTEVCNMTKELNNECKILMDEMVKIPHDVASQSEQVVEKIIDTHDTPDMVDNSTEDDMFSMVPASAVPAKAKGGRKKKTT
jgi:phage-related protein|uniref:Uncharacterized protein n=1 Tax=viral metagenome TaxID=1070528 RepID=A0A6C0BGV1_9ZZZZ